MLDHWFPAPEEIDLGYGRVAAVRPLRIRHLGRFAGWIRRSIPEPLDQLDPDAEGYEDGLRAAYDLYVEGGWPPEPFTEEWRAALYDNRAGRAFVLGALLVPSPELDLAGLASSLGRREMQVIESVSLQQDASATASDVLRAIDDYLGIEPFSDAAGFADDGSAVTWRRAIGEMCCAWGPRRVGALTVRQFQLVRSAAEEAEHSDPLPSEPDVAAEVNDRRRRFFYPQGLGRPGGATSGPDEASRAIHIQSHLCAGPPAPGS